MAHLGNSQFRQRIAFPDLGNAGVSLMTVVVATGLLGILSVVMTNLMSNANRMQQLAKISSDFQSSIALAKLAVADPVDCKTSMRRGSGPTRFSGRETPITAISIDRGVGSVLSKGANQGGFTVEKLQIEPAVGKAVQLDFGSGLDDYQLYTTKISIEATRTNQTLGTSTMSAFIPVAITTGPNGRSDIVSCSVDSDNIEVICQSLGGVYEAAAVPPCKLSPASFYANASCTQRISTAATKIACGFKSTAYCATGEFAMSGGMYKGSNAQLQNSLAEFDARGRPVGWTISAYDFSGAGLCTSNNYTANDTVHTGSPPSFQTNGSSMQGAAIVTCCK